MRGRRDEDIRRADASTEREERPSASRIFCPPSPSHSEACFRSDLPVTSSELQHWSRASTAPTSPLVSWHFLRMWRLERAAYVCRNGTCSASVMTAKALIE